MKLQTDPPLHLTYCLNVHPGESWAENYDAIRTRARAVRDRVLHGMERVPFGLGLRLGAEAAAELARPEALADLRAYLDDHGLYVFTVNGFPYGRFHGAGVKADVYRPDWRQPERLDYTRQLADILAELLPEGAAGSISTVPGYYKPWLAADTAGADRVAERLADAAAHLAELERRTGREIVLALEPEPDCMIETTDEAIDLFAGPRAEAMRARLESAHGLGSADAADALRRHLGVCLDTAHAAVEFEEPAKALEQLASSGVQVGKVQLSAALRLRPTPAALERLGEFDEAVYLHQVRARAGDGSVRAYADLPEALAAGADEADAEWRCHFHVPLFHDGDAEFGSTNDLLLGPLADLLTGGATQHIEIETYTWGVLPDDLRPDDVAAGIAAEYEWVLERMLG